MCREAVIEAGAELVRFARSVGPVPGEWGANRRFEVPVGKQGGSGSRARGAEALPGSARTSRRTTRSTQAHGQRSRRWQLFDRSEFVYDEESDTFRCPAGPKLWRKEYSKKDRALTYTPRRKVCGSCALKQRCTLSPRRYVSRNLYEDALQRMHQRTTAEVMRLRGSTVEHPFATIKYRIF
jgi:hypothetical protein